MNIDSNKKETYSHPLKIILAIYFKCAYNFILKNKFTILLVIGAITILSTKYGKFYNGLRTENEKLLFQTIVTFGLLSLGRSIFLLIIRDHIIIKKILSQKLFKLVFSLKIFLVCTIFILFVYILKVDIHRPINWAILIGVLFYNFCINSLKVKKARLKFDFLWKIPLIGDHSCFSSGIKLIINSVNKNHILSMAILYILAIVISLYSQLFMKFSITMVFFTLVSTINLSFITLSTDDIGSRGISLDRSWIKKNIIGETTLFLLFYVGILPILIGVEHLFTTELDYNPILILFFGSLYNTLAAITLKYLYPDNKIIQLFLIGLNIVVPFIFVYYFRKAFKNENH